MSAKTKTKRNKTIKTKTELDFERAKQGFAIATTIYKANSAYDKASAAQRRVMIAEDALKQLKIGRFVATPGTYVNAYRLAHEAKLDDRDNVQLNTLLHNPALKSSCNVCARGALFLSAVRFRNDCTINGSGDTSESSFVKEFADQQGRIEEAFEECDGEDYTYENGWADRFLHVNERNDPDKRLALILKNIIRNKGAFKPTER